MRRPPSASLITLILALALGAAAPGPAAAAWPHSPTINVPVCTAAGSQIFISMVTDGAGGALFTWTDYRTGTTDIYAQHVLASGAVDPAWPVNGLAVCTATGGQQRSVLASDGAGGAIVAWQDARGGANTDDIYATHVYASGTLDPAWPVNGLALCTATGAQTMPVLITDGVSRAIVTWQDGRPGSFIDDIYVTRVSFSGVIDAGWGANGVALCTATGNQTTPALVSDGAGGAIVTWTDSRQANTLICAQHVLSTGVVDASWTANGTLVCSAANGRQNPGIVTDGAGGAVVAWTDFRNGSTSDIYAQHVGSGGTVDGTWPVDGRALCAAANNQLGPVIATDGANGAIVAWYDYRGGATDDMYAQHVAANGVVDAAWPADGRALCTATGNQQYASILADGAGGAYVAWQDTRTNSGDDAYAQHVLASGAVDATWPADGRAVCTSPGSANLVTMVADGAGGVIVGWYDLRGGAAFDVYAQRIGRYGYLGTPEPVMEGVRDVPNDNGGRVRVAWDASWLDTETSLVARYDLYRAIPARVAQDRLIHGARLLRSPLEATGLPGEGVLAQRDGAQTYYWDYVDTRSATHFLAGYGVPEATLGDSMGAYNPRTAFMVVAFNTDGTLYWPSAPDSGYSVDNVPPIVPAPFLGAYAAGVTSLHWSANPESDLAGYRLYRGGSAAFVPGPANLVAAPTDTDYVDAAGGPYYYKLAAVDIHGNVSAYATLLPTGTADAAGAALPRALALAAPAPNPAHASATLRFALPRAGGVSLAVLDVTGRRVRTLAAGAMAAGDHAVAWDLRDASGAPAAAGLYFVRLEVDGERLTRRLAVAR